MKLLKRRASSDTAALAGLPGGSPYGPDWDVPATFNFTRDVVEQFASDPNRRALTFVDADGIVDRLTYAEVARRAGAWAELLRHQGLKPGDRVLVVIGKRPEWLTVMLGAIKAGLVAVPCSEMLRARDLAFRARHAGARCRRQQPGRQGGGAAAPLARGGARRDRGR